MKTEALLIIAISSIFLAACQSNNQSGEHTSHAANDSGNHSTTSGAAPISMLRLMDDMMKDMHQTSLTGNVDVDFAAMMRSHHQTAVKMAELEINSGENPKVKELAQSIVNAQKEEIEALDAFIRNNREAAKTYDPSNKVEGFARTLDKNMKMMMDLPEIDPASSTDKQFVDLMIPHHQTAVHMAEGYLQEGKDAKLIEMAKKMVSDQNKEIDIMKGFSVQDR